MLEETGYTDVRIGPAVDTFAGARGQDKARTYAVLGYPFLGMRPRG